MTSFEVSVLFFLQLAVILAACGVVSALARRLGQPPVVGEMIAGVLLGPSAFGLFWPAAQGALFPPASMPILFAAAQVGLVLYMFVVGLEFDPALVRRRLQGAAAVSAAGIAVPFALGAAIAWSWRDDPALFAPRATALEAMLFLGAAMSVTAFPMLARIIREQGLTGTALGALALAAGAFDDVAAWGVLAIVLAGFTGDATLAVWAIGGAVAYAGAMLTVGRRCLAWLVPAPAEAADPARLRVVLIAVLLAAWLTDTLRVYAVFGAFVLGVAMPRGPVTAALTARIEPLTAALFLPLFFVYSGLNTRLDVLDGPALWGLALLVLGAASLGKLGACGIAAWMAGVPGRDAAALGSLMNARGLMELVILNIGREHGLVQPALFTMMVTMAIVTTLAATPLFRWIMGRAVPEGALDASRSAAAGL